MNRRTFLTTAATGGAVALLGGGFLARYAVARSQVHQELMTVADSVLMKYHQKELHGDTDAAEAEARKGLPERAGEEMRVAYHGLCLHVHEFTEEVCRPGFAESLARSPAPERERRVLELFMTRVTTRNKILERVREVAEKMGRELDGDWTACCRELAGQWNLKIPDEARHLDPDLLTAQLTPLVGESVRGAASQANQRVALKGLAGTVGESALLLLELEASGAWSDWPKFIVRALSPVFQFFAQEVQGRAALLQRSVSGKLAELGGRVAAEFQQESKTRLNKLQEWQRQAVDAEARRQAGQLVRIV
jgi:hypothetical protein